MTVSEVFWGNTHGKGKCPVCHRDNQDLGTCNAMPADEDTGEPDVRCIDCFFNVPCEHWFECAHCGTWGPPEICSTCKKSMYKNSRSTTSTLLSKLLGTL